MPNNATGPAVYLEIGGVEYEAREFAWDSSILQLADQWSATLPAPEGKIRATSGEWMPANKVLTDGALVRIYESDPTVEGGRKIPKMKGRLVNIDDAESPEGGYQITLSGFDLGWHLTTGHGRVFTNLRGVAWKTFLERNVLDASLGWGFEGVRYGNLANKNLRLGRALIQTTLNPQIGAIQPRFQIEVGQSLGPLLIEFAKREGYLLNVSADGYLQFFRPDYEQQPLYTFRHYLRSDEVGSQFNNIMRPRLRRSAEQLYALVEAWNTVLRPPPVQDTEDPTEGRYHGAYANLGSLPFERRYTFSDPEQIGQDRANARAKWQWQRLRFDAWEYTFTVRGHAQNGIPFEPETLCDVVDPVRGINETLYITGVRCWRKLARAGIDRTTDTGTLAQITTHRAHLLGA
jgi:prophage tail gpP-like protein